jgi:hypothetical protein
LSTSLAMAGTRKPATPAASALRTCWRNAATSNSLAAVNGVFSTVTMPRSGKHYFMVSRVPRQA